MIAPLTEPYPHRKASRMMAFPEEALALLNKWKEEKSALHCVVLSEGILAINGLRCWIDSVEPVLRIGLSTSSEMELCSLKGAVFSFHDSARTAAGPEIQAKYESSFTIQFPSRLTVLL